MSLVPEKVGAESPFWRFSLRFYGQANVPSACIALQDEIGVDVNLLLFLLFLADHQRQVGADDIVRLDQAIMAWRSGVVMPLRELRRTLKTGIGEIPVAMSETFRGQIKRLELESEHIEQQVLESIGTATLGRPAASSRISAAEANLAVYEGYLEPFPEPARAVILAAFAEFQSRPQAI